MSVNGPSITEEQFDTLLRGFLLQVLPDGTTVVRGQANRVAPPPAGDSVVFIPLYRKRLAYTVETWDATDPDASTIDRMESTQIEAQLQFFGLGSTDNGQVFAGLFRSTYACDFFSGSGIQPLYCDDGQQMPFITGEDQYEDRWLIKAAFDANIVVTTSQQFMNEVAVGLVAVDVEYD